MKMSKIHSFFFYDNIRILHQNIAGLINKADILTVHLEELELKNIPIDIMCITEHFMIPEQEAAINLPNFRLAASFSRNVNRGGACIFTRVGHPYIVLNNKFSSKGIVEYSAIELTEHKLIIVCMYRVPNSCISTFFNNLENLLHQICVNTNKKIVVCGDFNINILKRHRQTLDFEQILENYNLKLEIKVPTRLISSTCIDNFAHNTRKCKSEIIELGLSDHTAQLLQFPVKKTCVIKTWRIKRRDYDEDNLTKFENCLNKLTFSDIYLTNDPNEAYDHFFGNFLMFL